jgi:hypothetical protein
VALITLQQGLDAKPFRQGRLGERASAHPIHPFVQGTDVEIGAGGQIAGLGEGGAATPLLQHPLLPVQEQLIVFEHHVVAKVLQPLGPQFQ